MRLLQHQVREATKREHALQQKLKAAQQDLEELSAAYEEEAQKVPFTCNESSFSLAGMHEIIIAL